MTSNAPSNPRQAPRAAQAGDELPVIQLPPISRTTLALFAGASGDHNPIHLDVDFACSSGKPDVFAQGMLGMAWLGRLLTQWQPQACLRSFTARFHGILQVGDSISCVGHVTERFLDDGVPCVRVELRAVDQAGETKIVGQAVLRLPVAQQRA